MFYVTTRVEPQFLQVGDYVMEFGDRFRVISVDHGTNVSRCELMSAKGRTRFVPFSRGFTVAKCL